MVTAARLVRVDWQKYFRIIRTIYPPIDLFEDVSFPVDRDSIIESKTGKDPAYMKSFGNLSNVPPERMVGGQGASWVMSPFVHISPSRFSDGSYGIFYAGNSEQVALAETIYHHERKMSNSYAVPGWTSGFQLLLGSISNELHNVDSVPGTRDPADYSRSQRAGKSLRNAGSDSLTWTSVRSSGGQCIGAFWPDVVSIPIASVQYRYHWDGERVDFIKNLDSGEIVGWP